MNRNLQMPTSVNQTANKIGGPLSRRVFSLTLHWRRSELHRSSKHLQYDGRGTRRMVRVVIATQRSRADASVADAFCNSSLDRIGIAPGY